MRLKKIKAGHYKTLDGRYSLKATPMRTWRPQVWDLYDGNKAIGHAFCLRDLKEDLARLIKNGTLSYRAKGEPCLPWNSTKAALDKHGVDDVVFDQNFK